MPRSDDDPLASTTSAAAYAARGSATAPMQRTTGRPAERFASCARASRRPRSGPSPTTTSWTGRWAPSAAMTLIACSIPDTLIGSASRDTTTIRAAPGSSPTARANASPSTLPGSSAATSTGGSRRCTGPGRVRRVASSSASVPTVSGTYRGKVRSTTIDIEVARSGTPLRRCGPQNASSTCGHSQACTRSGRSSAVSASSRAATGRDGWRGASGSSTSGSAAASTSARAGPGAAASVHSCPRRTSVAASCTVFVWLPPSSRRWPTTRILTAPTTSPASAHHRPPHGVTRCPTPPPRRGAGSHPTGPG